jgi:hypothetical protein
MRDFEIQNPGASMLLISKLIKTMQEVITYNENAEYYNAATLDMEDYINSEDVLEINHFCGTAACILGYQAIVDNPTETDSEDLSDRAGFIAQMLRNSLGTDMAQSIYETDYQVRRRSGIFAFVPNLDFVHLSSDETSPQDAIEYMEYVLTLCESKL